MPTIHQRYRQTDRRTDRRTTSDSNTVDRAVKSVNVLTSKDCVGVLNSRFRLLAAAVNVKQMYSPLLDGWKR